MKPSEALGLGKAMLPHGKGNFFVPDESGRLCACPLGMMLVADGVWGPWSDDTDYTTDDLVLDSRDVLLDRFPDLARRSPTPCDCDYGNERYISHIIAHMNDNHDWSPDEAQTWLEERGL